MKDWWSKNWDSVIWAAFLISAVVAVIGGLTYMHYAQEARKQDRIDSWRAIDHRVSVNMCISECIDNKLEQLKHSDSQIFGDASTKVMGHQDSVIDSAHKVCQQIYAGQSCCSDSGKPWEAPSAIHDTNGRYSKFGVCR